MLNRAGPALHHARRCLEICVANGIGDFDLAFAYEALARAHAVAGGTDQSRKYVRLGEEAAGQIRDEGNYRYVLGELDDVSVMLA